MVLNLYVSDAAVSNGLNQSFIRRNLTGFLLWTTAKRVWHTQTEERYILAVNWNVDFLLPYYKSSNGKRNYYKINTTQ